MNTWERRKAMPHWTSQWRFLLVIASGLPISSLDPETFWVLQVFWLIIVVGFKAFRQVDDPNPLDLRNVE